MMNSRREKIIKRIIQVLQSSAEFVLILILLLCMLIASYALWDIKFIASQGQPLLYAAYKPKEDKQGFDELKKINDEVIGWLDIYGTNIDYPVLQTTDNEKYLSYAVTKEYSLAGSIFLDYRNQSDFSDFNNVIHGHSMSHNVMFGDVSDFKDAKFFQEHRYGDLYFDDKHHGLRIIGFAQVDAYKTEFFKVWAITDQDKDKFFKEIEEQSLYVVDKQELDYDHTYVLLATCTSVATNGRHILICRLTDEVYEDTFGEDVKNVDAVEGSRIRITIFLIVLAIVLLMIIFAISLRNAERHNKRNQ